MKAVVFDQYGSADVLRVRDLPKPTPKDNELLIRVHAAEVTKADCELRQSKFPVKWTWLPVRLMMGPIKPRKRVLGGYFAGEVEAVGKKVEDYQPGDALYGCAAFRMGGHGEYICLPDSFTLAPKPTNLSFPEAAAVPLGGLNALHFMRKAEIKPGASVLVAGAGGSIGSFSIQIARALGASEITAVDHPRKEAMLRELEIDHFIDYTQVDFTKTGKQYDAILTTIANAYGFYDIIDALNPGGRYLVANPTMADMTRASLLGNKAGKKAIFALAGEKKEELEALTEMIEAGHIRPLVDSTLPYSEAQHAHRLVETEQRLGAVLLVSGEEILVSGKE